MPLVALGALAIGGSIVGGVMAKKGADAQAQAVKDSSAAAVAEQQRQYDLSRQDLAPWRNNGGAANNKLAYLLGVGPNYSQAPQSTNGVPQDGSSSLVPNRQNIPYNGNNQNPNARGSSNMLSQYSDGGNDTYGPGYSPNPTDVTAPSSDASPNPGFDTQGGYGSLMNDFSMADFNADPGYQFTLSEGAKALQRSAAAKGQLFSGGTLKDLTNYNQNAASTQYGNAYNRFNTNKLNRYNMLSGLSQGGQQAANNTVQAGTNAANNISNITVNAGEQIGNARASGYAGIGQAVNGGINNALSMYLLSQQGKG